MMSFDILPTEIIIKIFDYLPSEDIPSLICVCLRFKELLTSFTVKGTLNLEKAHHLSSGDLRSFFYKNSVAPTLKTLKLNGVWWWDSIKYISKCPNLRILHLLDVRLNSSQLKSIFITCTQIEDIAFTWPSDLTLMKVDEFSSCENVLNNIKVMKFLTYKWIPHLQFLSFTPSLIKLTIILDSINGRGHLKVRNSHSSPLCERESSHEIQALVFPNLKEVEIICRTMNYHRFLNRFHFSLDSASHCLEKLFGPFPNHSCLCKVAMNNINWMQHCEVMEFPMCYDLERRLNELTFPITKKLFLYGRLQNSVMNFVAKMPKLKEFHYFAKCPIPLSLLGLHKLHPKLEKLSFWCEKNSHSMSYVLGELEDFTELNHLCVPPCVLEEMLPEKISDKAASIMFLFKRRRIGEGKSTEKAGNAAFNRVIENCPFLKVLEIANFRKKSEDDFCERIPVHWQCLENLKKLSFLTHLTLESIPITSGAFLKEIAFGCEKLEYLRLRNLGLIGKCVYLKELSDALPLFKCLRNFRLENNYLLPGLILLSALSRCEKLERVVLISKKEVYLLDEAALVKLLQKKNLLFLYVDICGITSSCAVRINRQVKVTKSDKLFFQINTENSILQNSFLPLKHSREMVQYLPWITV